MLKILQCDNPKTDSIAQKVIYMVRNYYRPFTIQQDN